MPRVLIQSADPLELTAPDLDSLAQELRDQGHDVELTDRLRVGYGVTWWEVFHFVIEEAAPEVIDATVDAVIAAFIVWARGRFRKDGHGRAERAPKHATIYGPDGKTVLKEVSVKRDEEPEITTPEA